MDGARDGDVSVAWIDPTLGNNIGAGKDDDDWKDGVVWKNVEIDAGVGKDTGFGWDVDGIGKDATVDRDAEVKSGWWHGGLATVSSSSSWFPLHLSNKLLVIIVHYYLHCLIIAHRNKLFSKNNLTCSSRGAICLICLCFPTTTTRV